MTSDPLASHRVGCIQGNDRCAAYDLGFGSDRSCGLGDLLNGGRRRRIGLGDDDDVGHAQDGFARMMGGLVSGSQGIDENDMKAWSDERKVVVATVPEDDIRLLRGGLEDAGIVGTGKHQRADGKMRLVLLPLFDRALRGIQIPEALKPLHGLALEMAIGHRMADGDHAKAALFETSREPARDLRLSNTCSHRRDCDDGNARLQHGALWSQQGEIGASRQRDRCLVHDLGVLDIAVSKDHLVDRFSLADLGQVAFVGNGNAVGIAGPGQRGGIAPIGDPGDLGRRERHDFTRRIVTIDHIEIVEVAACRTHDDDATRSG